MLKFYTPHSLLAREWTSALHKMCLFETMCICMYVNRSKKYHIRLFHLKSKFQNYVGLRVNVPNIAPIEVNTTLAHRVQLLAIRKDSLITGWYLF